MIHTGYENIKKNIVHYPRLLQLTGQERYLLKTVLLIFRYRYENMNPQIFTAKSTTVASKVQPAVIDTLTV